MIWFVIEIFQRFFSYLSQIILRSSICVSSYFKCNKVLCLHSLVLYFSFANVFSYLFVLLMNTQATRGLSLGGDRSSQWVTGGTRPSVTLVLQPGFFGQDRTPEATDVLWGSRNLQRWEIPQTSFTNQSVSYKTIRCQNLVSESRPQVYQISLFAYIF